MPYKRPAVHGLPPRSVKEPKKEIEYNSDYNTDKSDFESTPKTDRSERSKYVRSGSLTRQQENDERAKRLGELAQKYHTQQFYHQQTTNQQPTNEQTTITQQRQQNITNKPPRTQRASSEKLTPRQHQPAVTEIVTDDEATTPRLPRPPSNSVIPPSPTQRTPRTQKPSLLPLPPSSSPSPVPPSSSPSSTSPTHPPIPEHPTNTTENTSKNEKNEKSEEKSKPASRPSSAKRSARHGISFYDNSLKPPNPRECIYISIRKVDLHKNILEDNSVEKIFVAYEFLRTDEQLETDSQPKKNNPFNFNFSREFRVSEFQYKLFSILNSTRKSDADIIFDVCNEQSTGECMLIGTSEINLLDLIEFGKNLENEALDILDEHDNNIGTMYIDFIAIECISNLKRK